MSLLVELTNLLHRHGAQSSEVRAFLREHSGDRAFARRARVLITLFRLTWGEGPPGGRPGR